MSQRKNFLFSTWEGGGNVMPAIEAARKLVAAGHRVRFLCEDCTRSDVLAAGAEFRPWTRAHNRKDRNPANEPHKDWAGATPVEGLMIVLRDAWCGPALKYAQDLIDELRREPADLVVTCEMLFGVIAGCESIGQPCVLLCPNISLAPIPGIPPMGPGLPPARTERDRAMHREIAAALQQLFDSGLPMLNQARSALGLAPLAHLLDQFDYTSAHLLATSPAFDFAPDSLPANVQYVGPQIADPAWAQPWTSPWPADDRRPLVVVSFSTTFQNHAAVLQRTIDALAILPVRVLVTLGGSINVSDLTPPHNCFLVESAPHHIVMPQAAFAITHGGHGTVMRTLVSRVPMLVIPHGRDQNDNAIRITERGAGLSLPKDATVDAIRAACMRLLREPEFKAAAQRLGDQVAHHAATSTIVSSLEAAAVNCSISGRSTENEKLAV